MLYTQKHLKNVLAPKGRKKHKHGLSMTQIKSLPDFLQSPEIIADSPAKSNSSIDITCELNGDNNCILYVNKQKSQDLFSSLQLQLPKAFNNLDYDTILHQSNNIVKTSGVRIDGIDNKSQMTLERWGEQYSELTSSFNP